MIIISNIHKVLLQTEGKQILKDFTLLYSADFTIYNTYEYCAELIVFGFAEKQGQKLVSSDALAVEVLHS